jgi:hypothetical protein
MEIPSYAMYISQIVAELVTKNDKDRPPYAKPTTLLVDPQVYRMEKNSGFVLPNQILLKVWDNDENVYCILKVKEQTRPDFPKFKLYTLELVEEPLSIMNNKILHDDGVPYSGQSYAYLRPSSEIYAESVMIMNMNRTRYYLEMEDKSRMYEYTIATPATVLGPLFYDICKGKDGANKYHFVAGKERACFRRPNPARPISKNTIPMHVFRSFVDQAIEKKECCPIMLDPLTKENVASPPCGHLFCYDAIVRALKISGKCPTCRCVIKMEELQHLA